MIDDKGRIVARTEPYPKPMTKRESHDGAIELINAYGQIIARAESAVQQVLNIGQIPDTWNAHLVGIGSIGLFISGETATAALVEYLTLYGWKLEDAPQ